ncbi:MAG TPA: ABC transporter permease [Acidisphaera sp.]|nr:ABC transporter permease [Acidisphaera sp.]
MQTRRLALSVGGVLAALLGWWALTATDVVAPELLAGPGAVIAALREMLANGYRGTTLQQNTLATLGRCLGGFGLATLIGVPLGLFMGVNRVASAALDWIVQVLRPLPPLSYMILLIVWLGVGNASKLALLFLTAFPIIVSASAAGVRGVARQRVQAAQSLGASDEAVFRHVIFPGALPQIFSGLRIALAAAFSTVVAAELLAATDGLGWMVISASHFLRSDIVELGIIVLGVLGMALGGALLALDLRVVHWRGRD